MEKFINLTDSNNEKSIKIGQNAPKDSAVLAWFNVDPISPEKNVTIFDLSGTILENRIPISGESELMYADEFGILSRSDGSSILSGNNISVSNIFTDRITSSQKLNASEIDSDNFAHHYYVSRYFTVAPAVFSVITLNDYLNSTRISDIGIKIIDQYGKDYVDQDTNKPKYKILLEPFKTDYNVNDSELPYKILVFLDATTPVGLKLIYNKFEVDEKGKRHNHQLRYTENINSVPMFKELPEESFVIDPNYIGSNTFSIKKVDNRFVNTSGQSNIVKNGYQAIVPSKAIKDYRTYEVFNWRIVGRVKRALNLREVNFGANRTVNACVLYSGSASGSNISPYIIYRLQNSPFNLSNFNFENPLINTQSKNAKSHWLVDIDSVSIQDLSRYDIVFWSPDFSITPLQAQKINDYITNKFGTIFLDLSNCPDAQRLFCGSQLQMSESVSANTASMNSDSYLIDSNKNGGWDINDNIFEKDYYGVFGSRYTRDLNAKTYKYFSNIVSDNSFIKVGPTTGSQQSIGATISYSPAVDNLSRGNVIATTFPVMEYCNKVYSLSGSEIPVNDNNEQTHVGNIETENVLPAIIEGPFKLLYNAVSYALYSKARGQQSSSTISSLTNFVTDWGSSWVMYSDALDDSEKNDFEITPISPSTSVYARVLTKNSASNNTSIFNYFKEKMSSKLPATQVAMLSEVSINDIDFFIEITNPDVSIKDATKIDNNNSVEINIPSSYSLHQINQPTGDTAHPANASLYAYTVKYSRSLSPISGMGPYVLLERPINSSSNRQLLSGFNSSSGFHSYSFRLKSSFVSYEGIDQPTVFQTKLNGELAYDLMGTIKRTRTTVITPEPALRTLKTSSAKSAIDDYGLLRAKSTSETSNVFPYTGDIEIHGQTRIWKQGWDSSGEGSNRFLSIEEAQAVASYLESLYVSNYYQLNPPTIVQVPDRLEERANVVPTSSQVAAQTIPTMTSSSDFRNIYINYYPNNYRTFIGPIITPLPIAEWKYWKKNASLPSGTKYSIGVVIKMNNDQYTVTVSQQDSDGDLKAILVSSRMSLAALRTYLGPSISIPADFFLAKVSNL
jgi:hypothetical protein